MEACILYCTDNFVLYRARSFLCYKYSTFSLVELALNHREISVEIRELQYVSKKWTKVQRKFARRQRGEGGGGNGGCPAECFTPLSHVATN